MQLPNGENALVDIEKLIEYCLSPQHPRGKHKARVFMSACGIGADYAEPLRQQLLEAAAKGQATELPEIGYGRRYNVEWNIAGPHGTALIRTAWIIRPEEDFPRFVSAFVL
jgi:hypothetical protein